MLEEYRVTKRSSIYATSSREEVEWAVGMRLMLEVIALSLVSPRECSRTHAKKANDIIMSETALSDSGMTLFNLLVLGRSMTPEGRKSINALLEGLTSTMPP